jgi:CBS domain-containing protein
MKIRRVKSVMTPFPHWIDAQEPLLAARDLMLELQVRHLPVKEHGELVSIVTDRDLKFAMDPKLGLPPREAMRVKDIAVYSAYVTDLETPLFVVLLEMAERRIGSSLVTRHGQLCGILTTTDICRTFGEELRERECPDGDPEAA